MPIEYITSGASRGIMNADEEPEAIMSRMQHVLSFPDPLLNAAMGNVVSAQL